VRLEKLNVKIFNREIKNWPEDAEVIARMDTVPPVEKFYTFSKILKIEILNFKSKLTMPTLPSSQ
jgi:hypothetical protein